MNPIKNSNVLDQCVDDCLSYFDGLKFRNDVNQKIIKESERGKLIEKIGRPRRLEISAEVENYFIKNLEKSQVHVFNGLVRAHTISVFNQLFEKENSLRKKALAVEGIDGNDLATIHNYVFDKLLSPDDNPLISMHQDMFISLLNNLQVIFNHFEIKPQDEGCEIPKQDQDINDSTKKQLLGNCFDLFSSKEYLELFTGLIPAACLKKFRDKKCKVKLKAFFIESFSKQIGKSSDFNEIYERILISSEKRLLEKLNNPEFREKLISHHKREKREKKDDTTHLGYYLDYCEGIKHSPHALDTMFGACPALLFENDFLDKLTKNFDEKLVEQLKRKCTKRNEILTAKKREKTRFTQILASSEYNFFSTNIPKKPINEFFQDFTSYELENWINSSKNKDKIDMKQLISDPESRNQYRLLLLAAQENYLAYKLYYSKEFTSLNSSDLEEVVFTPANSNIVVYYNYSEPLEKEESLEWEEEEELSEEEEQEYQDPLTLEEFLKIDGFVDAQQFEVEQAKISDDTRNNENPDQLKNTTQQNLKKAITETKTPKEIQKELNNERAKRWLARNNKINKCKTSNQKKLDDSAYIEPSLIIDKDSFQENLNRVRNENSRRHFESLFDSNLLKVSNDDFSGLKRLKSVSVKLSTNKKIPIYEIRDKNSAARIYFIELSSTFYAIGSTNSHNINKCSLFEKAKNLHTELQNQQDYANLNADNHSKKNRFNKTLSL